MSATALSWAIHASRGLGLSHEDRLVLAPVADQAGDDGLTTIHTTSLTGPTDMTWPQARACLDHLAQAGLLTLLGHDGPGTTTPDDEPGAWLETRLALRTSPGRAEP